MKINSIDENGILKEYDVILTYKSNKYAKDYIVYTDNKFNTKGELQIYIDEYLNKNNEYIINHITNKEEYNSIKKSINSILLTIKNESDKLNSME